MLDQFRKQLNDLKSYVVNGNHVKNNGKSPHPIGLMPTYTDPFLEQARSRKIPSLYILLKLYKGARETHESLCKANGKTCPSDIETLQVKLGAYLHELKEEIEDFEEEYGPIAELHICGNNKTAAVLTTKPKFLIDYQLGNDPALEDLLIKIEFLAAETNRLLKGRDLKECTRMIYSVAQKTLSLLDTVESVSQGEDGKGRELNRQTPTPKSTVDQAKVTTQLDPGQQEKKNETIASIKQLIQNAKAYHKRAAKLNAQLTYGIGTLMGIALLDVIVMFSWVWRFQTSIWLAIFMSGGLGATVSVMSRISAGQLVLDYEADKRTLRLLGVVRPVLGAVFAVIIVILLKSELVPNFVAANVDQNIPTLLVVGFLAGFSERFAPDLLDTAQGGLSNGE